MKYTSQIKLVDCSKEETDNINSLFFTEDKSIMNGRASFKTFIEPSSNNSNFDICFELEASDITALRAVFTLIIKALNVFEKTKKLLLDEKND